MAKNTGRNKTVVWSENTEENLTQQVSLAGVISGEI